MLVSGADGNSITCLAVQQPSHEQHRRILRAWHLALLRFAVTLDDADRQHVTIIAREMDSLGSTCDQRSFHYFTNLSSELCVAILGQSGSAALSIRSYLSQIDDPRMKRAFAAAVSLDGRLDPGVKPSKRRDMLWRGLA